MESLFELDTTLKELYENSIGDKAEIYVGATLPTIKVQTTKGLPVSVKYAYQDGLWPMQRDLLARLLTQVMPQWLGMIAGKLHLVMFDPIHRRLTDSVKATIEATSRRVGIRARDVRGIVSEKHPEALFTRKDIYNARSLLARQKLGGLSPTAALIKLFDERGISYIVKWSETEPDRLVGIVWTFPYCVRMWKRFPETMSFDNTYNTNRFKMPLFQVTGQTCLKSVYNAAFGLVDNERREGFPISRRRNYDKQMKAALDDQFPDSQQQICIHHINSNVLLNSKRRWKNTKEHWGDAESSPEIETQASLDSGDINAVLSMERQSDPSLNTDRAGPVSHNYRGVLEMWKFVAFAETKEEYERAWAKLCEEFKDQHEILAYIHKTYLPVRTVGPLLHQEISQFWGSGYIWYGGQQ
ncbi:hypothetical protein HIM_12216 [Hirsutella minnesotensis 3608]|uniref:MULE transposase domain-containing protein n=1 Tax=Hirsutella minnesotensis 3608 TaxID=1043627 RepID=A0A0F7ZF23_9HYPO|nr:hypothetical protein HIM_12216 [Hirsutella minnesotensis 3608]